MNTVSKTLEEQIKDLQKQLEDLHEKLKNCESENLSLRLQLSRLEKVVIIPQRPSNISNVSINLYDNLSEK
jgi:regulator of replication initiation timing